MVDAVALNALRTLIDPEVVAAWLDEVDSHRSRRDASPPPPASPVREPIRPEPLLSVTELSQRLGVRRGAIYDRVKTNEIPHIRFGSRIRFVWTRVEEWMDDPTRRSLT